MKILAFSNLKKKVLFFKITKELSDQELNGFVSSTADSLAVGRWFGCLFLGLFSQSPRMDVA